MKKRLREAARRKNTLNSQSAFCTHSVVCNLHFVPSLHFVSGLHSAFCSPLQSAFCNNRYPWHQYSLFLVTYSYLHNTHNRPQNTSVWVYSTFSFFSRVNNLSFCKNVDITDYVSIHSPTRKKKHLHAWLTCLRKRFSERHKHNVLVISDWETIKSLFVRRT